MDDSFYLDPTKGPGPVHVLRRYGQSTACGAKGYVVLYNPYGGPTNCQECKAAAVEQALDQPATGEPPTTCYRCEKSYCYQPLDDRPGFLECVHCGAVIKWDW